MYINIIFIAVSGALITNFSKLLQGKKVAQMGFYTIYILFLQYYPMHLFRQAVSQ